jgi:chromosome segregation ATPase
MTEAQRLQQMAAQQEMIRQGLEELQQNFDQAKDLLGDVDQLQREMEDAQKDLAEKHVDPRLMERQQKILSRLLDAQRSIRQQEMSPQRESKTATLAERQSPPPIPEELLKKDRTLEEDVLRGSDDRYPSQYRKLVEEYFRALSKETRNP